jgi:hypothetical protein
MILRALESGMDTALGVGDMPRLHTHVRTTWRIPGAV